MTWAFIKEAVECEHFYTGFDEEWKVLGKCDRTKRYELSVANWRKQQGLFVQFPCLSDKDALLPGIERAPLTCRSHDLHQGRPRSLFSIRHFLNSFSLKYSICLDAIFLSSMSWTPLISFLQLSQSVFWSELGSK